MHKYKKNNNLFYYCSLELFEDHSEGHPSSESHPSAVNNEPQTLTETHSDTSSCAPDRPSESSDVRECEKFVQQTCGCHLAKGAPCSSLFSVEHYIQLRAQSSFLTRDELDLTLLGSIMSTVVHGEYVRDGRHKPNKRRKKTTMLYMHHAHEICKKTFTFLYGIGKDRLRNVKDSYLTNGLETRVHGNIKRRPHNHLAHAVITNFTKFLENYTEENAILLPGRIPGYKRDDIKLLPSSRSKKVKLNY